MGFTAEDIDINFAIDLPIDHADSADASRAKNTLAAIKEDRQNAKDNLNQSQNIGYYFTVVCPDLEKKERLLEALGVPVYEEYVRGELIAAKCGITLEEPPLPI